jgi:hypothetical protein
MITVIAVPAEAAQPLRLEQLHPADLPGFQALVAGPFEPVDLHRPPASLYVNEEGKHRGLAPNPRATALAWVHNSSFRGRDVLVGDAFLAGPPDAAGDDTAAPGELVAVLLRARRFRVQVKRGPSRWEAARDAFDDVFRAYVHAIRLAMRDREITDVRVTPAA